MGRGDNGEINRKSGLAYGAAISLFVSVAAFCGVGWMLDRWLNKAPWFLVGGLVLGAIVGFIQFVRLTSQTY
jgi:F0F1-type ATP synthase assembly protein I